MEFQWKYIIEFNHHMISNYGHVHNVETDRILRQSKTLHGDLKVTVVEDGRHFTRSVKVLVANAFVDKPFEHFDTPIILDGHQENVRSDNLMWRPRHFAWKYHHQMQDISDVHYRGPVIDIITNTVYRDVVEAATFNGLLFQDIWRCLHNIDKDYRIFPTWQYFQFHRA